ncbi:oocyte zinc finger protein XlCOF6-like [Argiope bruennichi]|uniref:oocyte zinc finger protein XlCOF6-like n=1 Tax=Argiope bruennichi TaxID=94029 RepID=UPI0024956D97|nr:oocyte zinc finger protein XlCOF6-like [Argiope bruennichi]
MARYFCQICRRVLTYGEIHPCVFYKNDDNVYSLPTTGNSDDEEAKDKCTENSNENSLYLSQSFQQKENKESELINLSLYQHNEEFKPLPPKVNKNRNSAECSNNAQLSDPCDISYFYRISDAQATEVQGKENTFFTASSENIESAHRPEIVHLEVYEETIVSAGSSGFQIQNQSASDVTNLLYATTDEEHKTSLENSKWQTWNYDKKFFIDSLECVVKTGHSESKSISGNENLILRNVSESVNHKNISPEMHSQGHNNKKKRSTDLKEPISTKEDGNAVAGPSGFCSGKKKFPKNSCKKDTPKTNYRTRTSEKRDICKKEFSQKSGLNLHYITHTGKTPYACDVCGKEFTRKIDRDRHHRTHTGERPFVCYVCNKGFALKGHLKINVRTHTGEKPFLCDVCNEAFARKDTLKKHVRTHTGEKPFVCEVCNEAFAQKGNLKRHALTHTGEMLFVCDVCNEAFARKGTLKTHARTHTGEMPYKCPICGMAFTTSSGCYRHRRRRHK